MGGCCGDDIIFHCKLLSMLEEQTMLEVFGEFNCKKKDVTVFLIEQFSL